MSFIYQVLFNLHTEIREDNIQYTNIEYNTQYFFFPLQNNPRRPP